MRLPIAIIGNGGAAAEAILALRAARYPGEIHVFADNDHAPYNPMLGTYLVSGSIPMERAFPFGGRETFYAANEVSLHPNEAVLELDAEQRTFVTAVGTTYSYKRCLVATGARPAVPPIAGLREALVGPEPRRVFTIQSIAGAMALKEAAAALCGGAAGGNGHAGHARRAVDNPPVAVVVGASFAGVKVASVLRGLGMRVAMVEREPSLLPLSAHPECAHELERHLLEEGYELRLGAALSGVTPLPEELRLDFGALPGAADPAGAGGTACEDQMAQLTADLMVICAGNRPALGFLRPGQVDTGTGILVDDEMRSNHPTLYAAGDVAQGRNLLSGRHEIIGLWASARSQGRAAGWSMAGVHTGYRGSVPSNITHVGRLLFASVGCLREYDRIETSRRDGTFVLRAWQEGRLAGINLINSCSNAGVIKGALLRAATGSTAETEATWTSFSA